MYELTCGSLFSGVGGMDVGLAWAGFRHSFFAEIDPFARAVLAERFPGVPIYEDVRDVRENAGHVDLLAGGFPCQDLSVAGKRAGLAGERSGLFHEFVRVADALRPRALLVENVEGLYSSNGGRDFGVVLDALAERGYLASWRTLDAQHFGVPQRRRRVFVLAIADGDPGAARLGEVLALSEGSGGDSPTSDPSWPLTTARAGEGAPGGGGGDAVIEREREREERGRERGHGDDPLRGGRLHGAGGPPDRGRGYGVNPGNDEIAGALVGNSQGGQRTTDLAGAYVVRERELRAFRKSRRAASVTDDETWVDAEAANTLNTFDTGDTRTTHVVAATPTIFTDRGREGESRTEVNETGIHPSLRVRKGGGGRDHGVQYGATVRRLTPMECERLMGWPDGWTDIPWRGKDHAPDSRRYAACGNGVVAPVAYWIGARLAEVLRDD